MDLGLGWTLAWDGSWPRMDPDSLESLWQQLFILSLSRCRKSLGLSFTNWKLGWVESSSLVSLPFFQCRASLSLVVVILLIITDSLPMGASATALNIVLSFYLYPFLAHLVSFHCRLE